MAEIESQLAKMETSIRRDKAPRLYSEHNLGFEIIESDEDEERAVGVRVFQVGQNVIYAPIFFNGGELRGEELLWLKEQDLFVPFEDSWITYVQSREDLRLGTPGEMDEEPTTPSLLPFFEQPRTSGGFGTGSIKSSVLQAFAEKAQPPKIDLKQAFFDADEKARRSFCDFLSRDTKVAEYLVNKFDLHDVLTHDHGTPDLFQYEKKAPQTKVATQLSEVRTPGQKEKLLRDGYAVVKEAQGPKRELVEDAKKNLIQPAEAGFFRVYTEDGPKEMLLVPSSEAPHKDLVRARFKCVQWDTKEFPSISKTADDLVAIDDNRPGHWKKQYEDASDATPTPDNTYIAMGPGQGAVAGCFYVRDKVKLPNGHTKLKTRSGPNVIITTSPNGKLSTLSDGSLIIPESWKFVKVTKKPYSEGSGLITREELLFDEANELRIKDASAGLILESNRSRDHTRNRAEVIKILMEKYAFSEDTAQDIFSRWLDSGQKSFLYKQAQPPGLPITGVPSRPVPQGGMQGGPPMNPQLAQMAGTALQQGREPTVETSALGSLLAESDNAAFLRKYLGDILTATDRYGRYLYRIYWDWSDFVDEWGAKDLDELVSDIVTAFKLSGKIVLDIKQRLSGPEDLPIFEGA